jgi:hypothetical protein
MTLNDLGNMAQLRNRRVVLGRVLQTDTDKRTHIEAQRTGIDHQSATKNHARLVEFLDALVDRRTRNATLAGNLQEGHTRILDQKFQNLAINCIYIYFAHFLS